MSLLTLLLVTEAANRSRAGPSLRILDSSPECPSVERYIPEQLI